LRVQLNNSATVASASLQHSTRELTEDYSQLEARHAGTMALYNNVVADASQAGDKDTTLVPYKPNTSLHKNTLSGDICGREFHYFAGSSFTTQSKQTCLNNAQICALSVSAQSN
jgi:hypothetical protein